MAGLLSQPRAAGLLSTPQQGLLGGPVSVDDAVARAFGMQPNMDRLNLLPRYDRKQGWIAPGLLYQLARAVVSPGVAANGGEVSPQDAFNFAGNVSLGGIGASAAMKNPAPGPGKTVAATVYHGGPHKFNNVTPDAPYGAFDLSKIGTGEGAQAYGHGIYTAGYPGTARTYQWASPTEVRVGENRIVGKSGVDGRSDPATIAWHEVTAAFDGQHENPFATAKQRLSGKYGPRNEAHKKAIEVINEWQRNGATVQRGGHFYTVDLPDEHIAKMLDWDKPLSEQPDILKKLKASGYAVADDASITGGEFYRRVTQELGANPDEVSAALRADGIPGIKYLDGNSRVTSFGPQDSGTRNYVIFDPAIAKIINRE